MMRFVLIVIAAIIAPSAAQADDDPIYFLAPESTKLFETASEKDDFWPLSARFVTEEHQTYCGIASSVMVLNALGVTPPPAPDWYPYHYWDQSNIFTEAVLKALKPPTQIEGNGITLDELATLLETSGVRVERTFASEVDVATFRAKAIEALRRPDVYLVVNVDRPELHEVGGGHVSPIAAYNADADRFLMMDVARYKYLPSWISAEELHASMLPEDEASRKSRGYVIVSR